VEVCYGGEYSIVRFNTFFSDLKVSKDVYFLYAKAMGYFFVFLTFGQMLLNSAVSVYSSIWLSQWTNDRRFLNTTPNAYSTSEKEAALNLYLGVYGGLGVLQSECFVFRCRLSHYQCESLPV